MRMGFFAPQPTPTADHFVITGPTTISAGSAYVFTVTATTPAGSTDTGYAGTIAFSSSDPATTASNHAASTLAAGVSHFTATLTTSGGQCVNANDTLASNPNGSLPFTVLPKTMTHITTVAPGGAAAGVGFVVTATAWDQYNNVATTYTGTIALTSTDGAAVLGASATVTSGTGTFSVTLKTSGAQTVTCTDVASSDAGASGNITVAAAAPTHYVATNKSTATAGVQVLVTVTAEDVYNNTATGYGANVLLTSSDTNAILTVPGKNIIALGVGVFSATLTTSGAQTFTAKDQNSTLTVTTGNITVSAAAASQYLIKAPAAATHAVAITTTVTAEDQFNNVATGYAGTVAFSSTDTAATLHANGSLTAGVGTFNDTLATIGSQTITVEDVASSVTGTSAAILVS